MAETIEVHVTTTKAFFGEPLYLGEVIKDLVSQALRLERASLRVKHYTTDKTDTPAIKVFVAAVGNSQIGEQLENALSSQFSIGDVKRNMWIEFSFDGELSPTLPPAYKKPRATQCGASFFFVVLDLE